MKSSQGTLRADVRVEVFEEGPSGLLIRLTGKQTGVWVEGRCGDDPLLFCFAFLRLWLLGAKLMPSPATAPSSAVNTP